jgi:two-component system, OmpR family, sensor kinase
MIRTLYGKLVAVLLAFTLIMAVLLLIAIRQSDLARNQELNQIVYRNLPDRILTPDIMGHDGTVDAVTVRQAAERIQVVNPRVGIYLLDAQGNILAAPGLPEIPRGAVSVDPVERLLAGQTVPILGDDPADPGRRRVFAATRVRLNDGAQGYLYLVVRGRGGDTLVQRVTNSSVLREIVLLMACGLLVTLAAAALIVKIITRPLLHLAGTVDRFRRSGFAEHPEPARIRKGGRSDEIGQLADSFDRMAERMLVQMETMKRDDAARRELMANISHDLRTPLALLQGHLETLQVRNAVLSDGEKAAYLQIALRNTEQLGGLVTKLFELAKLDSEQPAVHPEPFVLEELIQDVGQQFELAMRAKHIRLETKVPTELPLVFGDIGLVERVLRNLIENALRYTAAHGTIGVVVTGGASVCTVEVHDSGIGIEPADIPRIFDRFYRAEKSRGAAATHAGLGLAIVKRIIELHGGSIQASSRPGLTVFSFTLAYAARGQASSTGESAGPIAENGRSRKTAGLSAPATPTAASAG